MASVVVGRFGWIVIAVLAVSSACSSALDPDSVPVVQLSTHSVVVAAGDSSELTLAGIPLLPPGYVPEELSWSSSDSSIAKIADDGRSAVVWGVRAGTAIISVQGDSARDSALVTVTPE